MLTPDFDINRDLAEDAAEDYSDDAEARKEFAAGWCDYCCGEGRIGSVSKAFIDGFIAARDAPD